MENDRATRRPKLLDQVRAALRVRHRSLRTEQAYVGWIRRYIFYHGVRNPNEMGAAEVVEFLSHLAVEGRVSASTQNQALSALLFLYREVLGRELEGLDSAVRARAPRRLPVVLTRGEVRALLALLEHEHALIGGFLYGGGLRLLECLRLWIKDLDPGRHQVTVREGKGDRDRATLLPDAIERKYPNAGREWGWQWVFPAPRLSRDRVAESCAGITFTSRHPSARFDARQREPASASGWRPTPCGTRSRRTCSRTERTSEPCSRCSATRTSAPR